MIYLLDCFTHTKVIRLSFLFETSEKKHNNKEIIKNGMAEVND